MYVLTIFTLMLLSVAMGDALAFLWFFVTKRLITGMPAHFFTIVVFWVWLVIAKIV